MQDLPPILVEESPPIRWAWTKHNERNLRVEEWHCFTIGNGAFLMKRRSNPYWDPFSFKCCFFVRRERPLPGPPKSTPGVTQNYINKGP